jgi:hypothetical protein
MEVINLELQIEVNKPEGMDQDALLDMLTDYIYKFQKDGADIQIVTILKIDGDSII